MHNKLIGVCRRTLPSCVPRRITKFDIDYNNNNTLLHTLVPFVVIHSRTGQQVLSYIRGTCTMLVSWRICRRLSRLSYLFHSFVHSLIHMRIHTARTHTLLSFFRTQYICISHNLFSLFSLSLSHSFFLYLSLSLPPRPFTHVLYVQLNFLMSFRILVNDNYQLLSTP